jgi:orotidine-5'-phosphate decarboxylase
MTYKELYENIKKKGSFLCVGLDPDISFIPEHIRRNAAEPLLEFNKTIIDATAEYSVAYKLNLAFYEAEGAKGWEQLAMTVDYIRSRYPSMFIIADAKRGDIGNTAELYAKTFFDTMEFDSVTVTPYMGRDSVDPFLKYKSKWTIILALTSNPSADDFETLPVPGVVQLLEDSALYETDPMLYREPNYSTEPLYKTIIDKAMKWGTIENTMFVVGATRAIKLAEIREYCPNHFLLVPGVGAQGGTIAEVAKYGMNDSCGLLINISRSIIYAGQGEDFAEAAGRKAAEAATEMGLILSKNQIR